ncbi:tautomerase family protein [Amycolatopsis anabasis]|uniref:tautomerase family protein n=1 Tax=Amycolatopsis anabasis TaxID=1840409 RepID=UPI00131C3142|nr:4-oxalocrotonate tautomerase family protein [Amycolatopsis anabasis]
MPVVNVNWWKGAGEQQRRELVEEVTKTVSRIAGCPAAAVTVIVSDVEQDHWGTGGRLAADL